MNNIQKPIKFSEHAKNQLKYRGATEEEVIQTIRNAAWQPAELGRLECIHEFEFNNIWNGKLYKRKEVRPIFVEEDKIVVVTIYVYYS